MTDWLSLTAIVGFLGCIVVGAFCYDYGVKQGIVRATKLPNLIHPSMSDITIIGRYTIPKQTTEEIAKKLKMPLIARGYAIGFQPNVILVFNQTEPQTASKKKKYFDKLNCYRDGYPSELTLKILDSAEDTNFLEIEAICLPVMSLKMGQGYDSTFPKSHVEDAQRMCKDLMAQTMCVLNARILIEPFIESSAAKSLKTEVLHNTLTIDNINKKAHELIAETKTQIRLAGWIDREFLGDLEAANTRGVDIRILTKNADASDKLIKDDFSRLLKIFGKRVRLNSRFHDRFLICDDKAIIGSMYFVYASKTRYESSVFSEDHNIVNPLKQQFDQIWDDPNSKIP